MMRKLLQLMHCWLRRNYLFVLLLLVNIYDIYIHCVSKKVPTFEFSVTLSKLNWFSNFCTAGKRMKFATKHIRRYALQWCKNFENPLRFEKVTEILKMGTFLRHSVYFYGYQELNIRRWISRHGKTRLRKGAWLELGSLRASELFRYCSTVSYTFLHF